MSTRELAADGEEQAPASGEYPLANVLGACPNVSIRPDSAREVFREIVSWIIAGLGLGAIAWVIFLLAMRWAQ